MATEKTRRVKAEELLEQRITRAHGALYQMLTEPVASRDRLRADFHKLCGLIEAHAIILAGLPENPRTKLNDHAADELGIDLPAFSALIDRRR